MEDGNKIKYQTYEAPGEELVDYNIIISQTQEDIWWGESRGFRFLYGIHPKMNLICRRTIVLGKIYCTTNTVIGTTKNDCNVTSRVPLFESPVHNLFYCDSR